jgi:hypothetical protein
MRCAVGFGSPVTAQTSFSFAPPEPKVDRLRSTSAALAMDCVPFGFPGFADACTREIYHVGRRNSIMWNSSNR